MCLSIPISSWLTDANVSAGEERMDNDELAQLILSRPESAKCRIPASGDTQKIVAGGEREGKAGDQLIRV